MTEHQIAIMGGCGSSGTTLLTHLLSKHPQIGSGPEFNCFNHCEIYDFKLLKKRFKTMFLGNCKPCGYVDVHVFMTHREHYGIEADLLAKWVGLSNSTDDFLAHISRHMKARLHSEWFLEKSPTNIYGFKALAEGHPSIPLIHLVRDGRDVAASLVKRGFNLYFAGTRWLYDTLTGLRARGSSSYLEVTYEHLVTSPQETISQILSHIGVDPNLYTSPESQPSENSHGVYEEHWSERKEPRSWNQTPSDPISTASIGRYKKAFSERELSILYRIKLSKRALENLNTDIKTFGELIDHLKFEPFPLATREITIAQTLQEKQLELQDYVRRLLRYKDNGRLSFPAIFSTIS